MIRYLYVFSKSTPSTFHFSTRMTYMWPFIFVVVTDILAGALILKRNHLFAAVLHAAELHFAAVLHGYITTTPPRIFTFSNFKIINPPPPPVFLLFWILITSTHPPYFTSFNLTNAGVYIIHYIDAFPSIKYSKFWLIL